MQHESIPMGAALNPIQIDQFEGCLLATALGDALAAPYEGGPLEHLLWKVIGKHKGKHRWTDDTQMTLDVATSLIAQKRIHQDDLATRFAQSHKWSRGYGPAASQTLKHIKRGMPWQKAARLKYPDGSFGNGGAMRVAPISLFYANAPLQTVRKAACQSAEVTHAHPLGIAGAELVATAIVLAVKQMEPQAILRQLNGCDFPEPYLSQLNLIEQWLGTKRDIPPSTIAKETGNGILATRSCVTAVYCALSHLNAPFDQLLSLVISLKGDTDTIASMASGIWGAANGATKLPSELLDKLEQAQHIRQAADDLFDAAKTITAVSGNPK